MIGLVFIKHKNFFQYSLPLMLILYKTYPGSMYILQIALTSNFLKYFILEYNNHKKILSYFIVDKD